MRSNRIDQWLIILGMMLVLMSSYFLFWHQEGQGSALSLGRLAATSSIVKTKTPFTLDWKDAFSGIDVSENQLVYTDQNSSADIVFHSGDEVKVGENSLIRITGSGNSMGMDVGQGQIEAKIKSGEPLAVSLNGEEYTISSKDARVQINWLQGKGEIGVSDGSVVVEKEGSSEQISSDKVLMIEGNEAKLTSITFKLQKPASKELLTMVEPQKAVSFIWEPATKAQLEVTSLLTKKTQTIDAESGASLNLSEGSYQWRVKNEQGVSLTSSFSLLQEKPLQVLRPLSGEQVEVVQENNQNKLLLQWQGHAFEEYQIEYELNNKPQALSIKGSSALVELAEIPESFRWRARLNKASRELAQWSEWQSPSIKVILAPNVPQNLSPHEVEFQLFEKNVKSDIPLSWQSEQPVVIEISGPQGIETITASKGEANYQTNLAGKFKWRAKAVDTYQRESNWSDWKIFEVVDLSGETEKGKWQRIQLKKPNQEVTFEWKADAGTTSVFEISQDESFKEIIKSSQVKGGKTKVAVPRVGTYYWRSRLYLPNGTYEVSEPKRVIIEQGPPPGKPEKLPDLEVPLEWKETKTQFKFWHLLLAPAYADDEKSMVTIKLPVHEEAKAFHLKIFSKDNSTTPVFEKELSSPEFEWVGAEPGDYLWQYAIVDFWGRMSPYSDLSHLTITNAAPRRPLLISPIKAQSVSNRELSFEWKEADKAQSYDLVIASDADFKKVILQKKKIKSTKLELKDAVNGTGLYYWQIKAHHKSQQEVLSSVGRFTLQNEAKLGEPQIEILARPAGSFKKRIFLGWIPSKETFDFDDNNQSGEISGNTLMGILARGHMNLSEYMLSGELVRQSGKVFKGESYLFQKLQLDGGYKWRKGAHLFVLGGGLAQISSQEYKISNNTVTASSLSSLSLGPVVRGFHPLTEKSEIQSKFSYLLSSIKEMELSAEYLSHQPNYYWAAGVGYISREIVEGEQTSLRLTLGLGKDF